MLQENLNHWRRREDDHQDSVFYDDEHISWIDGKKKTIDTDAIVDRVHADMAIEEADETGEEHEAVA